MSLTTQTRKLISMEVGESLEIRFHSVRGESKKYQMLVSVNGDVLGFTLRRIPLSAFTEAITNISVEDWEIQELPMKAVRGWQEEVVAWLTQTHPRTGEPVYEIDSIR